MDSAISNNFPEWRGSVDASGGAPPDDTAKSWVIALVIVGLVALCLVIMCILIIFCNRVVLKQGGQSSAKTKSSGKEKAEIGSNSKSPDIEIGQPLTTSSPKIPESPLLSEIPTETNQGTDSSQSGPNRYNQVNLHDAPLNVRIRPDLINGHHTAKRNLDDYVSSMASFPGEQILRDLHNAQEERVSL